MDVPRRKEIDQTENCEITQFSKFWTYVVIRYIKLKGFRFGGIGSWIW